MISESVCSCAKREFPFCASLHSFIYIAIRRNHDPIEKGPKRNLAPLTKFCNPPPPRYASAGEGSSRFDDLILLFHTPDPPHFRVAGKKERTTETFPRERVG